MGAETGFDGGPLMDKWQDWWARLGKARGFADVILAPEALQAGVLVPVLAQDGRVLNPVRSVGIEQSVNEVGVVVVKFLQSTPTGFVVSRCKPVQAEPSQE